jgi:hypothetical protein
MINWKRFERRRSWLNLRYYHGIHLDGQKNTKTSVRIAGLLAEI